MAQQLSRLSAAEFGNRYAERSGVTIGWLKEHGREVSPCDCDAEECEGWQMAHVREDAPWELPPKEEQAPE